MAQNGNHVRTTDGGKSTEQNEESIHILNVFPDIHTDELSETIEQRDEIADVLHNRTNGSVSMTTIVPEKGAASLEDPLDVITNSPYMVEAVQQTDTPYDAIVVDCFGDPALDALRQITDVPVVGANQAACSIASQLGRNFSIISILQEIEFMLENLVTKYGFTNQLSSIRTVETEVLKLEQQFEETAERIYRESKAAIVEDGAHSIVLGCTGMNSLRQEVVSLLREDGLNVPVVEPLSAGIHTAVTQARLDVYPSRSAYYPPRSKKRILDFDIEVKSNE